MPTPAPRRSALLTRRSRVVLSHHVQLVLRSEPPPARPLGHLRIRLLLPLGRYQTSIAGHYCTVDHSHGYLGNLSPSPPSRKSVITERRAPHDSLAGRVAANPALVKDLAAKEITEVAIAGMQSNYCVAESSRGALKRGLQAILASGAHATYDENEPASAISAQIERELATEGITVLPFRKVSFEEAS
jgi:hypothetical protein